MKWITATFPNLHIHGVAKFEGGVFRSTEPQVLAQMAPWVGRYGITQVAEDTDPPDLPLRDPWPGAVLDIELFGEDGKVRESVLPPRLSDVELRAAFVAGRVFNNDGTVNATKRLHVKLTPDGLDIDDLIIEDVA